MEDYSSMSYYEIKAECKKLKLDSKGTKETLLARLGVLPAEPEPEVLAPEPEKKILAATPEDLNRFLPSSTGKPPVDNSKYAVWLTPERLNILENKIKPLAASRGKFRFNLDYEGSAFQVEFSGKGPLLESTTLIDTDQQIVTRARVYFTTPLVVGKNNAQSAV